MSNVAEPVSARSQPAFFSASLISPAANASGLGQSGAEILAVFSVANAIVQKHDNANAINVFFINGFLAAYRGRPTIDP